MPPIKQLCKFLPLWIGAVLISSLLLAGCGALKSQTSASPTPLASGAVLFEDDFSDVPSGWGIWNRKGGLVTYEQGGLRILVNQLNFDYWSVAGRQFRDADLEVDATRMAGAADNDFGLICRYQDNRNFYMFMVTSDGYYAIAKLKDSQHSLMGTKQLQYSDQIKADLTSHHLQAGCAGDRLSLSVDGLKLLEVHDSDFSGGDVGVMAGAYSSAGVDVLFDNFIVRQP